MKLYVDTMDAVVVDVDAGGRVRLENEDWSHPTLQERRAIIHAAQEELKRTQADKEELSRQLDTLKAQIQQFGDKLGELQRNYNDCSTNLDKERVVHYAKQTVIDDLQSQLNQIKARQP